MLSLLDFAIVFFPNFILVILYLFVDKFTKQPKLFLFSWFSMLVLMFGIGWFSWESQHEISRVGNGLILSSSTWISGLLMTFFISDRKFGVWMILVSFSLGFLSVALCFFLLIATGQIWGL